MDSNATSTTHIYNYPRIQKSSQKAEVRSTATLAMLVSGQKVKSLRQQRGGEGQKNINYSTAHIHL